MISKRDKIIFPLLLTCLAGALFLYFQHRTSEKPEVPEKTAVRTYPEPRHAIEGFQYEGHHEGRKILSLHAEKFQIEKKKIGFLRFGLMNVARFTKATLDIYGKRVESEGSTAPETSSRPTLTLPAPVPDQNISFKGAFTEQAMPSFPGQKIASIIMEPVIVRLRDQTSTLTKISANSATIRLREGEILFKKNVRVESGSRVLTTEELSMVPKDGLLRTRQRYVMKTPEKWFAGEGVTTNMALVAR